MSAPQPIYCISGIGADERIFSKLSIPGYEFVVLPWVPYSQADDMTTYAAKMTAHLPANDVVLLGLSFGGMLAAEAAKQHPGWQVFLVSSAKTRDEVGFNSRFLRWLSGSWLLPARLFNMPNLFALFSFSARSVQERRLLRQIIKDSDPHLIKWSVKTILHWAGQQVPANIIHIHGTRDRIIRPARVGAHYWLKSGTHLMIYNRAAEVSEIIAGCLRSA